MKIGCYDDSGLHLEWSHGFAISVLRGTDSKVTVHYFRNLTTKMDVEFKFKFK